MQFKKKILFHVLLRSHKVFKDRIVLIFWLCVIKWTRCHVSWEICANLDKEIRRKPKLSPSTWRIANCMTRFH